MTIRDRMHPKVVEILDHNNDLVAPFAAVRKAHEDMSYLFQTVAPEAAMALIQEDGAGTYNYDVLLPAGSLITGIYIHAIALWTAGTSASLEVGDYTTAATPVAIDADGFFTAVNLKATDLLAGESLSMLGGGAGTAEAGVYLANTATQWTNLYSATERILRFSVVSVGAGTAGRTIVAVTFIAPGEHLVTVTQ